MSDELEFIEASTGQGIFVAVASCLSVFAAGAAIGFFTAKKKYKKLYSDLAEQEIKESKIFYSKLNKEGEFADPVELAENTGAAQFAAITTVAELTRDYRSDQPDDSAVVNVFDTGSAGWDYQLELAKRDAEPDEPYIISLEEFMQNEPEHDQITMTYYEGDEVLSDERDAPIENEEVIIGKPENLRFGHGSNDNNIVYIRNESSNTDFEIVHSDGKYAKEVLGFIEHNDDDGRPRKFRLHE